jgi:putative transposase
VHQARVTGAVLDTDGKLLFKAVAQTLLIFGRTHLGGLLGFSVCSTPGIRRYAIIFPCLIPAGALSLDRTRWIHARKNFLFSVKGLSLVFRGKFIGLLRQAFDNEKLRDWLQG